MSLPLPYLFFAGVFVASFSWFTHAPLWALFILGIGLTAFYIKKEISLIGLCVLFFALGIWRFDHRFLEIEQSQLRNYAQVSPEAILIGFVAERPQEREKVIRFPFVVEEVIAQGSSSSAHGKVLVTAGRYPVYSYGERLKLIGRLELPQGVEGFNYNNYLASHGIEATISFPNTESLGDTRTSFLFALRKGLFAMRAGLQDGIRRTLSPPQSAVAEAVLFGDESGMSKEFKEALNTSGLRHITAVSGMNITIISRMLLFLGLAIGLWRKHAFYFALATLTIYILMIGAPASAVRAGIMGALFLLAQHVGRPNDAARAIVFAAALMAALNPLSPVYDVGFQLSFLAILGIVYWEEFFQSRLSFFPNPKFLPTRSLVAMTLSAQLFTFPILLHNFGKVSLIALAANILVVPLLPILMALSFLTGILGLVSEQIGFIASFPTWFLATYLVRIAEFSAQLPFATIRMGSLSFLPVLTAYLLLGFFTWKIKQEEKQRIL